MSTWETFSEVVMTTTERVVCNTAFHTFQGRSWRRSMTALARIPQTPKADPDSPHANLLPCFLATSLSFFNSIPTNYFFLYNR